MPSFDAGFYHLTALIPIHRAEADPGLWRWQPRPSSPVHSLRELLDSFRSVDVPDLATEEAGRLPAARPVPFSRNLRTHFARLVVVEDLAYNGLRQSDTLWGLLRAVAGGPQVPPRQRIDQLPQPCLLVLIDFDSPDGQRQSVVGYLEDLWQSMEQEWTLILRHCPGFDRDPSRRLESFVQLILEHEIESTFSFSAYGWGAERARRWQPTSGRFLPPAAVSRLGPLLPLLLWGLLTAAALLLLLGLLIRWLSGLLLLPLAGPLQRLPWAAALLPQPGAPTTLPAVLLALGVLVLLLPLLWQRLLRQANRPWPRHSGTDLRAVLKALYLQRSFLEFAEDWQNRPAGSDASLRRRFRAFLEHSQPDDHDGPSLQPGQIHAVRHRRQP